MATFYTVNADHLKDQADKMEADASGNLRAWVLVGQSDRYSKAMAEVRALRAAAAERHVSIRREILRNAGFIVKTPRKAGAC